LLSEEPALVFFRNPPSEKPEDDLMQLALTEEETEILRDLLDAYLPELKREVARTDRHSLRHALVQRQELVERLLEQLGTVTP
jgi:hypothetical protein